MGGMGERGMNGRGDKSRAGVEVSTTESAHGSNTVEEERPSEHE